MGAHVPQRVPAGGGKRGTSVITLPLAWALAILVLASLLGGTIGRRLPPACYGLDFRVVARHVRALVFVPPLCVLALIGDIMLTWAPDLQWRLPQALLVYYAPLSRSIALGVLAYVGTMVSTLALRARHPQVKLVMVSAVTFLIAFLAAQYANARPIDVTALRHQEKDGVILQTSSATCVAAACANIVRTYGMNMSEADMVTALGTTMRGTSTAQVVLGMSRLGFACRLVDARSIEQVHPPALLLVNGADSHAVAYMGAQDNRLIVLDPMRGRTLLTPELLSRIWRGHAIELQLR